MPRATQDTGRPQSASGTGLSPSADRLSRLFPSPLSCHRPVLQPPHGRNRAGLGSSPFARHYLGNHILFSLPAGTKMFQFPALAPAHRTCGCRAVSPTGCPIQTPADHRSHAPTRGFSQLAASFIAFRSPGIHRTPFLAFDARAPQGAQACKLEPCTGAAAKRTRTGRDNICLYCCLFCSMMSMTECGAYPASEVENNGFEPLTPCVQSRCSSQLS